MGGPVGDAAEFALVAGEEADVLASTRVSMRHAGVRRRSACATVE